VLRAVPRRRRAASTTARTRRPIRPGASRAASRPTSRPPTPRSPPASRRLITFHYDQDYSDADVDALAAACRAYLDDHGGAAIELIPAAEGRELSL
jgi:hypothetical protein